MMTCTRIAATYSTAGTSKASATLFGAGTDPRVAATRRYDLIARTTLPVSRYPMSNTRFLISTPTPTFYRSPGKISLLESVPLTSLTPLSTLHSLASSTATSTPHSSTVVHLSRQGMFRATSRAPEVIVVPEAVGPGRCLGSAVVPVSQTLPSQLGKSRASVEKILQQGFEVKLGVDTAACKECAPGVCSYDLSTNKTVCHCADGSSGSATCVPSAAGGPQGQPGSKGFHGWGEIFSAGVLAIGVSISAIGTIFIFKITNGIFPWKLLLFKKEKDHDVEKLMGIHGSLVPKRYRYVDLKKMTNSFSEKLGQGGFGVVYKGKIEDGFPVAVKILTESKSSPEEFINEVVSITRTSHVNVITLLGFCFEGNKRGLIFEYMPNGSLDKFIYAGRALNMNSSLEWKILYQIAIGIARGLEYLHRGCNTKILHFDIKPQNILLDRDFIPKISDFGLAKLCHGQESAVSIPGMRGTIGFIAPEVAYRNLGRVSHKSDVYSYGMLVIQMVGIRNSDIKVSNSSEMYFPEWIYRNLEVGKHLKLPMNVTEEEEVLARKMLIVSLWCIQTNPIDRPPIAKVIEMLEGSFELLQMPPKPVLYSPTRPPSQHGEMTTSNSNGSHEEDRIVENLEGSNDKWQSGNA